MTCDLPITPFQSRAIGNIRKTSLCCRQSCTYNGALAKYSVPNIPQIYLTSGGFPTGCIIFCTDTENASACHSHFPLFPHFIFPLFPNPFPPSSPFLPLLLPHPQETPSIHHRKTGHIPPPSSPSPSLLAPPTPTPYTPAAAGARCRTRSCRGGCWTSTRTWSCRRGRCRRSAIAAALAAVGCGVCRPRGGLVGV